MSGWLVQVTFGPADAQSVDMYAVWTENEAEAVKKAIEVYSLSDEHIVSPVIIMDDEALTEMGLEPGKACPFDAGDK